MSREMVFLLFFAIFAGVLMYGGWITRRWLSAHSCS